ncbi:uncharacterized protein [Palaemon carinicauda]|uniref:uncharacterized protein n=1 Tax=Palaemon carinicauda TaxID=392227 RepID=UPI0035B59E33
MKELDISPIQYPGPKSRREKKAAASPLEPTSASQTQQKESEPFIEEIRAIQRGARQETGRGFVPTWFRPLRPCLPISHLLELVGGVKWCGGALDWSGSAAPPRDDVIYVLFINSGSGWREVVQTTSRNTHIPPGVTGVPRLRLLAVTQEGVVAASDTLLQTHSTRQGTVEYKVEEIRPDASDQSTGESIIRDVTSSLEPTEIQPSEFYPYEHFESQKVTPKDAFPEGSSSLVDPTWALQVVRVESGIMAEVQVAWESRGPDGVEYLLSWVEETGGVSGHLLTDQLTTELSLWPGQGYYVQVELVDSQGNPVMKSLATPVMFRSLANGGGINTERNIPPTVTIQDTSPRSQDILVPSEAPTSTTLDDMHRSGWLNDGTPSSIYISPATTKTPGENLQDIVHHSRDDLSEFLPPRSESDYTKVTSQVDSELGGSSSEGGISSSMPPERPPSRGGSSTGVSAREIPKIIAAESSSEEVLWYVGVSIGVLLLLILCSLVLWSLGKCRKTPRSSEYIEDRLNGVRASFREDFIRRNSDNPQTSWTFEKCRESARDQRMGPSSSRKDDMPGRIDNASLVENYVLMLESRPPKKKPRN